MASKNRNLSAMPTNTNSMKVPVGNTATRGANTAGFIRFNSDLNTLEAANGTVWANVGSGSASSSGGGSSALGGVINTNANAISSSITMTTSGQSVGSVTVADGAAVTMSYGTRWVVF